MATKAKMDPDKALEHLGFTVLKTIGEGGYGTVKLAEAKSHLNNVAIKIMDPEMSEDPKFAAICQPKELSILEKVKHPNIIEVHEIHKMYTGQAFVVMEAADMDLCSKIEELDNVVPIDQAKMWFRQILNAMIYLHDQNIAHRDIKCENILLTSDNQVRLSDFGLGCFCKTFPALNGTYCGSLYYMAPEVLRGDYYDAKKADVWSLGVLLYILVTGLDPYSGENSETFRKAHKKPFKFPKGTTLDKDCRSIISYMLQVDPLKRPTMREVAQHPWVRPKRDSYHHALHGEQSDHPATAQGQSTVTTNEDDEPTCLKKKAEKENGFGCFPLGHGVRRTTRAVLQPLLQASRLIRERMRTIFRRRSVVCQ